ncbi:hypothetical protein CYMTET_6126 [Cymbomonas tetramitiformis]|uniref:Helicase C-terminal domain-containing protein n=1 Tax=Cymbomonas tetramitiformis TaxID=36881 RepID=A0AAE0GXS2_9CHLO|nr:hypothetical protein CYMTET_6126 [Cymbomonas tetramitiformis]
MHELYALLCYILPDVFTNASLFEAGYSEVRGGREVDGKVLQAARIMLESLMIRRIKAEVETTLLPKLEYKVYVPLAPLQRRWYQHVLSKDSGLKEILTTNQLMAKLSQLQKVCNHPKQVLIGLDRRRAEAAAKLRAAEGSDYAHLQVRKQMGLIETIGGIAMEAELRDLSGETLVAGSGKLALLDRLLLRLRTSGSRVLLFSQFTETLDVLEEYCNYRFGRVNEAYLRLDGTTNRISRELDMRTFNAAGSSVFVYLISTKAGGMGINLATADTVVLYDSCWNPQVDLQAQDRAHRIGQKKQVRIFRMVTEGTAEERIIARAEQKMVLDAMVVKKQSEEVQQQLAQGLQGGTVHLQDVEIADNGTCAAPADGGDDGELADAGMNVKDLLGMLSYGASEMFKSQDGAGHEQQMTVAALDRRVGKILGDADNTTGAETALQEEVACAPHAPAEADVEKEIARLRVEGHRTIFDDAAAMVAAAEGGPNFPGGTQAVAMAEGSEHAAAAPSAPGGFERQAGDGLDEERNGRGAGSRMGKRQIVAPKRYNPPSILKQVGKRRKLQHDDACYNCTDGGDLLECGVCPRVYHLECAGLKAVPKGIWRCPWHECWGCARNKSSVGGMLFQCVSCPLAHCFDCCPEEYLKKNEPFTAYKANLEYRGYSTKTSMLFKCTDCAAAKVQAPFASHTHLSGVPTVDRFFPTTESKKAEAVEVIDVVSDEDASEDELAPGSQVEVYWRLDRAWYSGEVGNTGDDGLTEVTYDDGEVERLDMTTEKYRAVLPAKEGGARDRDTAGEARSRGAGGSGVPDAEYVTMAFKKKRKADPSVKFHCLECNGVFLPTPSGGMRKHKSRRPEGGHCPGSDGGSKIRQIQAN